MNLFLACVLGLLMPWTAAQSTSNTSSSSSSSLAGYPSCAQTCLEAAFTNTTFCLDPSNSTCTCNNVGFNDYVTACVLGSCSLKDALVTENATTLLCDRPVTNRSSTLITQTTAMLVTTCVLIFFRVLFKIFVDPQGLWWDDYLLVILLLCGGGPDMILSIVVLAPLGIGRDIWTLSFSAIDSIFKYNYIELVLYFPQMAALKCTFLCFFLRIFTAPEARRVIIGTMIVTIVWGVASTFVGIFQCWPISYYWVWDGSPGGKCINKNNVLLANAVISIALDVWILAIPLWHIRKLNMPWMKRASIASMFIIGAFVTIVSCIRLKYLRDVVTSSNPTQVLYNITLWSTIEGNVSVYCACMPMFRQIALRLRPQQRSGTARSNHRRSKYYRIFNSRRTGVTGGARNGTDPSGNKMSSNSGGMDSTAQSTGTKRGFWTAAIASVQRDEEEDSHGFHPHRGSQSSGTGLTTADGSNIMYTTTYEVDYESAPSSREPSGIMMQNLHGNPEPMAAPKAPHETYQASARYGR